MIKTEFQFEVPDDNFHKDKTEHDNPEQKQPQETNELLAAIIAYKLKALDKIIHGKSIVPAENPTIQQMLDAFDQYRIRMIRILAGAKVIIPKKEK